MDIQQKPIQNYNRKAWYNNIIEINNETDKSKTFNVLDNTARIRVINFAISKANMHSVFD